MNIRGLVGVLLFGFLVAPTWAQDDPKKPFEALLQSMAWSSVLSRDHDLTVTVRYGSNQDNTGGPVPSSSFEGLVKSRQIYDSSTGDHWIPYAMGAFALKFDSKNVDPIDQRSVGIFLGNKDGAKEVSFNGRATKTIRGAADPLRASNPIDILLVTTNPCASRPKNDTFASSNLDILLKRLESLDSKHLRVSEEKLDKRSVIVYRVKAIPIPESVSIATHKIVVSAEGYDKGLIVQFSTDSMKLDDKRPYENDNQLIADSPQTQRIYWKEFEAQDTKQQTKKLVLPVSIARSDKDSNGGGYMNVSLEWNSFSSPKKELRSIEACEKVAQEFDKEISKALNR